MLRAMRDRPCRIPPPTALAGVRDLALPAPSRDAGSLPIRRPTAMPDSAIHTLDAFDYLQRMQQLEASDLFLSVGAPAHVKVEGHSQAMDDRVLGPGEVKQLAYQLMNQKQISDFERELEMDLAVSMQGRGRFRANGYYQRGEVAKAIRL